LYQFYGQILLKVCPIGSDRIGFGKLKIFRVDFVRSFQGGVAKNGLMFGLRF
jgi:hypothetical protein